MASTAVYWHFYYSQIQLLLAAAVLGAYFLLRRGWSLSPAVLVLGAGLLKLYPLVLLPWFLWRGAGSPGARARRAAVVAGLALLLVGITGLDLWRGFLAHGLPVIRDFVTNRTANVSLPAFVGSLGHAARDLPPAIPVGRAWELAGALAGFAALALAYVPSLLKSGDRESEFCLLTVAMLLGSLTTWPHYFVFLIFPMTVLAARVALHPSRGRVVALVLLLMVLNSFGTWYGAWINRQLYGLEGIPPNLLPLLGLLATGAFFAVHSWRHHVTEGPLPAEPLNGPPRAPTPASPGATWVPGESAQPRGAGGEPRGSSARGPLVPS